jgi:hypothetical protein
MRVSLRHTTWALFLTTSASALCVAQATPASPTHPARVCVATFKNETKQQLDVTALRDRLSVYLKRGPLAKQAGAEIMPIKEDTEQAAAPEIREQKCDFVVFFRVVLGRVKEPPPDPHANDPMAATVFNNDRNKPEPPPTVVLGVQFTAVRVSSGIPVLIDRLFLDKPFTKEDELWPLLLVVQERIETVLQKKLAIQPNPHAPS